MQAPAPTYGSDKTNKRDRARAAGAARIDPRERETKGQTDRESERERERERFIDVGSARKTERHAERASLSRMEMSCARLLMISSL